MAEGREAVQGRPQPSPLQPLMAEDWEEPLVPRALMIRRACTCDEGGACERVAPVGLAFADAIEGSPALLLRWHGCLEGDEAAPSADMWLAVELPEPAEVRAFPAGAMLKRLGPSGIAVGDEDLAEVLERAYEAFPSA